MTLRISSIGVSSVWVETTTASIRVGLPSSYWTVTWLLLSGRSQGMVPSLRSSVIRLMIRCDSAIGIGISSGVSFVA